MAAVPQARPAAPLTRRDKDIQVIRAEIAKGNRDENKLTNAVFYDRHPEWRGKELKNASVTLRTEWVNLRNGVVRETLKTPPPPPPKPAAPPLPAECSTAVEKAVGKCITLQERTRLYTSLVQQDGQEKWPSVWFFRPGEPQPAGTFQPPQFAWANTQKCAPGELTAALKADEEYSKLRSFETLYKMINRAVAESSLSLARYGHGKIVFSMEKGALHGLLMEEGTKKAVEALVANISELKTPAAMHEHVPLADKLITALGVAHSFLELAEGIHNEKMMGAVGKDADEWRENKRFEFVTLIIAEQIRKKSPAAPGASAEWLRFQYKRFQPVFFRWSNAKQREELFRKYGCKPPTPQTSMSAR
jgi:hypothetical protein